MVALPSAFAGVGGGGGGGGGCIVSLDVLLLLPHADSTSKDAATPKNSERMLCFPVRLSQLQKLADMREMP